jgi:hypothetical protein
VKADIRSLYLAMMEIRRRDVGTTRFTDQSENTKTAMLNSPVTR